MRLVPLDTLFLQPRVHLQWLCRAGRLRFELDDALAAEFDALWRDYERRGCPPPPDFLYDHPLTDNDPLFALFAGAVHARAQLPEFWMDIESDAVVWHKANTLE